MSLSAIPDMVVRQSAAREADPTRGRESAMSGLVLPESTVQTLGLVASSRRSLFMTGPAGNGKTTIASGAYIKPNTAKSGFPTPSKSTVK